MKKEKNIYGHGISYIDALSFDDYKLCSTFAFTANSEYLLEKVVDLLWTKYRVIFAAYCRNNSISIENETVYSIAFKFACSLEYSEVALSV